MTTLMEFLNGHPELMPNYLMLSVLASSSGYVFGRSIPLLSPPRAATVASRVRGAASTTPSSKSLYRYFKENLPPNRFQALRCLRGDKPTRSARRTLPRSTITRPACLCLEAAAGPSATPSISDFWEATSSLTTLPIGTRSSTGG